MKKIRRLSAILSLAFFMLMMSPESYTVVRAEDISSKNQASDNKGVRLQDDFYDAINNDWLSTVKIEEGKSTTSTFDDVEKTVKGQVKSIIKSLVSEKEKYAANTDERKIINLYNNVLNVQERNNQGLKPVKENLDKIKSAQTIDDITKLWSDRSIVNSTIQFAVEKDVKNITTNILYINHTGLSLGDSDQYTHPTESTAKNKKLTVNYYNKLLMLSGYTKDEANLKTDNMFKFEEMIAPYIMGKREKALTPNLIDSLYNVYTLDELKDLAPNLNLPIIMKELGIDNANKIVLQDPKWLKALNKIYTQENLPLIKNYLEIVNLIYASNYLSKDFEDANTEFSNNLLGIKGSGSKEDDAVDTVNSLMGMAIGKIYSERYVSKNVKEDVENITKKIIEVYKKRINNLTWMSSSTKKNAIDKLDKLNIKIGYPDTWVDYSKLNIKAYEEGGTLFGNVIALRRFAQDEMFSKLNKPVDKKKDGVEPQTVNAFYSPTDNSIIIPGGIIQGHFYDPNGSKETNLGGIGVILGHEISHAFDNTGAQYDADGNLNNWWSDDDYKEFQQKTQKVKDFYSQIEVAPGQMLDGNLTAGENIADIGGVSCLLDILKTMDNPNYKTFFQSYAVTWRQLTTKEYSDYAMLIDSHSPNKVRVNAVLPQFQQFYDTYGITEKDGMYIRPEDRVAIW